MSRKLLSDDMLKGVPSKSTSVRLPVKLIDKAKELGVNRSQLITEILIERLGIDAEKEFYRYLIDKKYQEIEDLSAKLDEIERIEGKVKEELKGKWKEAITVFKASYKRDKVINPNALKYWASELKVPVEDLKAIIQKEVIEDA